VAPVDGAAQGLVARDVIPRPARQHLEATGEPAEQRRRGKDAGAGRRQLDGHWSVFRRGSPAICRTRPNTTATPRPHHGNHTPPLLEWRQPRPRASRQTTRTEKGERCWTRYTHWHHGAASHPRTSRRRQRTREDGATGGNGRGFTRR